MLRIPAGVIVTALLCSLMGCHQQQVPQPGGQQPRIVKLDAKYLPNAVRVHPKVISGGLPEGDAAFAELQSLGVKTIISVDGAKPDVARAAKFALRYVHLPHGYDGVPQERAQELAKAVRDLPGPIYIHCHHGKHRSPAATAVACVSAGLIDQTDAASILKVAGTSEHYRGLFESANHARRIDDALLDALNVEFPAIAKLTALAEAMVEIEQAHDHLRVLQQSQWQRIPDKPALEAAHEALLLREHFTELLRAEDVNKRPARFRKLLNESELAAQSLEDALRQSQAKRASDALKVISDNCTICHRKFRDVPLREKMHPR